MPWFSKEADSILVKVVVGAVVDGCNTTDGGAVAEREEQLSLGGAIKRIGLHVERIAHREPERRHPLRMIFPVIDLPREIYEPAQIARRLD